jgi:hypothetical protein
MHETLNAGGAHAGAQANGDFVGMRLLCRWTLNPFIGIFESYRRRLYRGPCFDVFRVLLCVDVPRDDRLNGCLTTFPTRRPLALVPLVHCLYVKLASVSVFIELHDQRPWRSKSAVAFCGPQFFFTFLRRRVRRTVFTVERLIAAGRYVRCSRNSS